MSQSTLPVRKDDPDTSYAAALKAAVGASRVRPVVLDIIRESGPLTHDQLIAEYHSRVIMDPDTPRASESGIRTRLKELATAGLVEAAAAKGVSNFGNAAKQWIAVDPDDLTTSASLAPAVDAGLTARFDEDDIVGFTADDLTSRTDDTHDADGDDL